MPPEFSVSSDPVDVDEIMKQIRARIRDRRGAEYTEDEIHQLAKATIEKLLDPTRVPPELVEYYRRIQESSGVPLPVPPPGNDAAGGSSAEVPAEGAGVGLLAGIRRLFKALLRRVISRKSIIYVLYRQGAINAENNEHLARMEWVASLNYELIRNLVVEMTRLGLEVKSLKMRVESVSSRLDFSDRRARAPESVVQHRAGAGPAAEAVRAPSAAAGLASRRESEAPGGGGPTKGEAQRAKRRRRRRGRGGATGQPGPAGGGPLPIETGGPPEPAAAHQESGAANQDASLPFERDAAAPAGSSAPPAGDSTDQ